MSLLIFSGIWTRESGQRRCLRIEVRGLIVQLKSIYLLQSTLLYIFWLPLFIQPHILRSATATTSRRPWQVNYTSKSTMKDENESLYEFMLVSLQALACYHNSLYNCLERLNFCILHFGAFSIYTLLVQNTRIYCKARPFLALWSYSLAYKG